MFKIYSNPNVIFENGTGRIRLNYTPLTYSGDGQGASTHSEEEVREMGGFVYTIPTAGQHFGQTIGMVPGTWDNSWNINVPNWRLAGNVGNVYGVISTGSTKTDYCGYVFYQAPTQTAVTYQLFSYYGASATMHSQYANCANYLQYYNYGDYWTIYFNNPPYTIRSMIKEPKLLQGDDIIMIGVY